MDDFDPMDSMDGTRGRVVLRQRQSHGPVAAIAAHAQGDARLGRAAQPADRGSAGEAAIRHLAGRKSARAFSAKFATGTGAQYTSGFPLAPGGNLPSLFHLAYSQTLFFNPSARADVQSADGHAEAQRLSVAQVRAAVIQQTASMYFELVAIRRSLERQASAVTGVDELVDVTLNQLAEGRALRSDVLRARLSAARARQQIIDLEGRASVIEQQLRDATGVDPGQPFQIALEGLPRSPDRTMDTLVAAAQANSPELRVVEAERRASEEHLAAQRKGYWPSLDLVGTLLGARSIQ